jgi:hypothetical protein
MDKSLIGRSLHADGQVLVDSDAELPVVLNPT